MKLETTLIHAGSEVDPATGAIAPPIHLSTTFEHGPAGEVPHGFSYIRVNNPTQARLEAALATVEGGEAALVFASGLAAGAAYLQSLPPDSHVILHKDTYFGFREIASMFFGKWGCEYTIVDMKDTLSVRHALLPNTRAIWMETPSNPLLEVIDIAAMAQIAHTAGAQLVVDGTFATPVLQRPLALGADVVLHAATKYLGGHSDVQMGALVFGKHDKAVQEITHNRTILGAVASPFNSWLVLRGLRTLACRMDRHSANGLAVAQWLARQSQVERVHYPGLAQHPGHEIAQRQMSSFGGMLSFQVKGGQERAIDVASRVKLFTNATSLGSVESLLELRASSEGPGSAVPDNLLRVSVGLEAVEDLIADLQQALG
ncbi:MAG: PLP-dependent transferase [Anaerolineaceae bacterium]|nr:MAG: PLP-dependent transferase [Anaerolineaceae bacterium]